MSTFAEAKEQPELQALGIKTKADLQAAIAKGEAQRIGWEIEEAK